MAQNDNNSTLGAGTDSISVTGAGGGQSSTSGGYTPSSAGSQAMGTPGQQTGGSPAGSSQVGAQGYIQQAQQTAQQLGDKASSTLNEAKDKAASTLNDVKGQAADRLGQVRDQAGQLKNTVADKLDQGAQALRQQAQGQGGGQQLAGAAGGVVSADQVQRLAAPAANAMEKTADFLRSGDLRGAVEDQVRTNPGRTLLIALGLGYVLGKAIRR